MYDINRIDASDESNRYEPLAMYLTTYVPTNFSLKTTPAPTNLNLDFPQTKVQTPREFEEAESAVFHITARKLGSSSEGLLPSSTGRGG